jgi:hypothetical protein
MRKLELRRDGAHARRVILRSAPFFLADEEGSPQFAGKFSGWVFKETARKGFP